MKFEKNYKISFFGELKKRFMGKWGEIQLEKLFESD